jgi:hypothetical protein
MGVKAQLNAQGLRQVDLMQAVQNTQAFIQGIELGELLADEAGRWRVSL